MSIPHRPSFVPLAPMFSEFSWSICNRKRGSALPSKGLEQVLGKGGKAHLVSWRNVLHHRYLLTTVRRCTDACGCSFVMR